MQRDSLPQRATKVRFYREVNSGKLDIKKKSREEMIQLLEKHAYPKKGDGSGFWGFVGFWDLRFREFRI